MAVAAEARADNDIDRSKLRPPLTAANTVIRSRLACHFHPDNFRPLTLITAPAGFGKTILMKATHDELREAGHPAVWLSLDCEDCDPAEFTRALAAGVGAELNPQGAMFSAGFPGSQLAAPHETLLRGIVNLICRQERRVHVFLDNYARVESPAIEKIVASLVERLTHKVAVVLGSRVMPSLPVGRLRVAGLIREIHADELSFTAEESARFFASAANVTLQDFSVTALHSQWHGWAAGLQLARSALERYVHETHAVLDFTLQHLLAREYLQSEVLAPLSAAQKQLLWTLGQLDHLCEGLCLALRPQKDTPALLQQLFRHLLIRRTADESGDRCELHPILRNHLRAIPAPEINVDVRSIHRAACDWYSENHMTEEAIDCCARAEDFHRMADLIESCQIEFLMQGRMGVLEHWLKRLPVALIHDRSQLQLMQSWVLMWRGQCPQARSILEGVTVAVQPQAFATRSSEAVDKALPTGLRTMRHLLAFFSDDWNEFSKIAAEEEPREASPESAHAGIMHNIRAYSLYALGRYDSVARIAALARPVHEHHRNASAQIFLDSVVGLAHFEQLHLEGARDCYAHALTYGVGRRATRPIISALPAALLSQLHYERDELEDAERYLNPATLNIGHFSCAESIIAVASAGAFIEVARGRCESALDLLAKAEAQGREGRFERVIASLLSTRLQVLLRNHEATAAAEVGAEVSALLARHKAQRAGDPRVFFDLTCARARWHLFKEEPRGALELLEPLLSVLRCRNQRARLVRVLILVAAAKQDLKRIDCASIHLGEALRLAAAARFHRAFIDDVELIREVLDRTISNVDELKARKLGFGDAACLVRFLRRLGKEPSDECCAQLYGADRIDPLTERERSVLNALTLGKSNRGIAESLGIAESTVAWHMKSVLRKMWVTTRTEAIAKASRLGARAAIV